MADLRLGTKGTRVGTKGARVGAINIKCKVLKNVSLSPDPVGKCCSRL